MANFAQRLKQLREEKDFLQKELGAKLDISRATIASWESANRIPELGTVEKLADFFGVTIDYLLGRTNTKYPLINHRIPLLGQIRAGVPILAEENWEEQIEIPSHLKADFALRILGDSMSWVGIHEGDIAVLKQIDAPQHGMIVAAGVEDVTWSASLKYFINDNGTPKLRAANPEYEDTPIGPAHKIIGQVVHIFKEPPPVFTYKDILISKETMDKQWDHTVEKAIQLGFKPEQVKEMVEVQWQLAQRLNSKKSK